MDLLQELEKIIYSYYLVNIRAKNRSQGYIDSRYIFIQIAFENLKRSKTSIARHIGTKHDNVINYLNKFDGIIKSDKEVKKIYESVLSDFKKLDDSILNYNERAKRNLLEYHKQRVEELNLEINE